MFGKIVSGKTLLRREGERSFHKPRFRLRRSLLTNLLIHVRSFPSDRAKSSRVFYHVLFCPAGSDATDREAVAVAAPSRRREEFSQAEVPTSPFAPYKFHSRGVGIIWWRTIAAPSRRREEVRLSAMSVDRNILFD